MAIGYYNFGNVQQGNQSIANSLAGLGQQIGNAIETHAATQSAQAMLPMLKQQYAQGMQKIASGDPNGMADVYGAAVTASQNPLLANFAKSAVTTAQSANINAQHMLRTKAYLGGRMASLYGQYGSGLMSAPEGMNPNWQGKQSQTKALNPAQQMSALANFNKVDTDLATKMDDALRLGDQATYNQLAQQRQAIRDSLTAGGITTPALPAYTSSFDTSSQLKKAQKELKAEQAKGTGHWFGGNTDPKKVEALKQQIQQLEGSAGQLPSARTGGVPVNLQQGTGPVIPQKAIDYLMKNPGTADQFDSLFGKGAAQQILNPQGSVDNTGAGGIAQSGPESADESEAVEGGETEEEPTSNTEESMVS
jgi:hypothetical protein